MALVDGDHPIIWEMLVHYLSHLGHFLVKDLRYEAKQDEDDGGLLSESYGPMLSVRIGWQLVVNIIILNSIDEILYKATVETQSGEIVERIILRHHLLFGNRVPRVPSPPD